MKNPDWYNQVPPKNSYRSVFKWGALDQFKHPRMELVELLKKKFEMSDEDFKEKILVGDETIENVPKSKLAEAHVKALKQIVGDENFFVDGYTRVKYGYGKTLHDSLRLRRKIIENLTDAVVAPRNKEDVVAIVKYCNEHKIPIYPFGGGSSVTFGVEAVKGGITLNLGAHMNRVIDVNETNLTCTVEPGIFGPALENELNSCKKSRKTKYNFTCGHFPQSFEYSTVGGWIAAKGAGQASTHYGKIEDLVICMEWVTPTGIIKTLDFPKAAIGPDIDQMFIGSEGAFGILVEATLKIFHYQPSDRKFFSFVFKDYESGLKATQVIMQSEFYKPSVFRLSDPEETDFGLHLYGVMDTPVNTTLKVLGYKEGKRSLLIGMVDGIKSQTMLTNSLIHKICIGHGALPIGSFAVKKWMHSRYMDPYMREDLQDYGIIIDTLETSVTFENMSKVRDAVRAVIKSRPNTICMTHTSHYYKQGGNLYFIFLVKMNEIDEFKAFQKTILDAIFESGGTMSHHHGVGKMIAPWLEKQLGKNQLAIFKALKNHFDPNNIMNPGGTLGLD